MNIAATQLRTTPARIQAPNKADAGKTAATQTECLDSFFAADAALVVGGLGILAAPAMAGAAFGVAGIAAATAGGALLDTFVPDSSPSEPSSKFSGAITLAALAGTGAVLGAPGVLAAAAVAGACGLMLSWADTFHG